MTEDGEHESGKDEEKKLRFFGRGDRRNRLGDDDVERVVETKKKPVDDEVTEKVLGRLEDKQEGEFVGGFDAGLEVVYGMDPEKELSDSGWSCFLRPGQEVREGVQIIGLEGEVVELKDRKAPLPINNVEVIVVNGKRLTPGADFWMNPTLFLESRPDEMKLGEFFHTLADVEQLWQRAIESEEAVKKWMEEKFGAEVVENVAGIIEAAEEFPELQENHYWADSFDIWDMALGAESLDEAVKEMRSGGLYYSLKGTNLESKLIEIMGSIRSGTALQPGDRSLVDAISMVDILTRVSSRELTYVQINEYTRKYTYAKVAENLLMRDYVGWEVFESHQQGYENLSRELVDSGYDVPEWFTGYRGDEYWWGIALDGGAANAGGYFFVDHKMSSRDVMKVLNHERGHAIFRQTSVMGKIEYGLRKKTLEEMRADMEKNDESFTEAFSVLVEGGGDVNRAKEICRDSAVRYKTGVLEMLDILAECEDVSGDKLMGVKLLIDGLKRVSGGETLQQTKVLEEYYDRECAKEPGKYKLRMGRFEDTRGKKNRWNPGEPPSAEAVVAVASQVVNTLRFSDLSDKDRSAYWREEKHFEESRQWLLKKLKKRPTQILDVKREYLEKVALEAVSRDPTARAQLQDRVDHYYQQYLLAVSNYVKTGERPVGK